MLRHQTTVLQPIGKLHAVIVKSRAPRGATGSRQRGIRIIMFQCYNENPEDYYNSNGQWASNLGARSGNKWHVLETHHRETWLWGNRLGFIRQILATNKIKVPFLRTDEIIIDNQAEGMLKLQLPPTVKEQHQRKFPVLLPFSDHWIAISCVVRPCFSRKKQKKQRCSVTSSSAA